MLDNKLPSFIAFDVETATAQRNSICQLGYAIIEKDSIVEKNAFLVQPPNNEYTVFNSCLHGISALDTKNEPTFPTIWAKIKDLFTTNILVAHNAEFDLDVLVKTLSYYKLKIPKFKYECTYAMTYLKLKALCESLRIKMEKHHDALSDAVACAQAFILLNKGVEPDHNLIIPEEKKGMFEGHERIKGDLLRPDLEISDKSHPFFNKKVVFTGVLQTISREEAAKVVKLKGADIDTGISKKTHYVIVGQGAGPSKLKKIEELNSKGFQIKIINETEFLDITKQ